MVEEAKQRRKKLKLTQQRLALLAKVSTPTISRFENGEQDIQWSSIHGILSCLGLIDERRLDFPDPRPRYRAGIGVNFLGKEGDHQVQCLISEEALQDSFNSDGENPMKIFKKNQKAIEQRARQKYLLSTNSKNKEILVTNNDF